MWRTPLLRQPTDAMVVRTVAPPNPPRVRPRRPTGLGSTFVKDSVAATQLATIALAQLGMEIGAAIKQSVGREYDSNAIVITLFLLNVRGPMRPVELAEELGFTSGGVSKLLGRLEKLGAVQRSGHDGRDMRAITVRLTPAGRRVSRQIAHAVRGAVDRLPETVETLARTSRPTSSTDRDLTRTPRGAAR